MFNFTKLLSPINEVSKLIEKLKGFSEVREQLLLGNYEPILWWSFYLLLAIIELFLILSFFWLLIKRILLEPNHSDKRNTRKLILGIIFISAVQIFVGIPFLYPILPIRISLG